MLMYRITSWKNYKSLSLEAFPVAVEGQVGAKLIVVLVKEAQ